MKWWLRTQHATLTALAVVLLSVLALASIEVSLPFPALSGSLPFAPVPLQSVLALLIALLLAISLGSSERPLLWSSSRNVPLLQAFVLGATILIVLIVGGISVLLGGQWTACWLLLRTVAGYLSILTLARAFGVGRLAGVVPVLYLGAASIFGRQEDGSAAPWAWPLSREENAQSWLIVLVFLAAAALIVECLRRRRLGTH